MKFGFDATERCEILNSLPTNDRRKTMMEKTPRATVCCCSLVVDVMTGFVTGLLCVFLL